MSTTSSSSKGEHADADSLQLDPWEEVDVDLIAEPVSAMIRALETLLDHPDRTEGPLTQR